MRILDSIHFRIPPQVSPYVVYLFFGAGDVLLYVGLTKDFRDRCAAHAEKAWFAEVERVEFLPCETRSGAAAAEANLIRNRTPLYNRSAGVVMADKTRPDLPVMQRVTIKVPDPLLNWLMSEADRQDFPVSEVILRILENAWELEDAGSPGWTKPKQRP